MALSLGIVGLPNVGKSTLFNAITKAAVEASNYPFCTIDPNVGIVCVPDERLPVLAKMSVSKQIVPAAIEFVDIAGLVKGASQGEGLGNQFLANIREVSAIVHVVRCFEDSKVVHVDGNVDPIRDIEIINTELILADLQTIEKRLDALAKKAKAQDKEALISLALLNNLSNLLLAGEPARKAILTDEEEKIISSFNLMTKKPIIYVANISEDDLINNQVNQHVDKVMIKANQEQAKVILLSAKIEAEVASLEEEDALEFLQELGIKEQGLNKLIKASYDLLKMITFITTGEMETKAWTIKQGTKAPQAAGVIHTDFEKGFIKAEVISYQDLVASKNMLIAKEKGLVRMEGKEYVMKDGDIVHFKFNV